jgi:hypothetical protein
MIQGLQVLLLYMSRFRAAALGSVRHVKSAAFLVREVYRPKYIANIVYCVAFKAGCKLDFQHLQLYYRLGPTEVSSQFSEFMARSPGTLARVLC